MTTDTSTSTSALGVLARQEIRHYLTSRLFWVGAALSVVTVAVSVATDEHNVGATTYAIAPAALLGVLGLVTMFGLTRRSDRAAESAGTVTVPERTRTLALCASVVVPAATALVLWAVVMIAFLVQDRPDWLLPPGVSPSFVLAQGFGIGVIAAAGGPLLGLLLARYLPRRGVAVIAAVVLVIVTILLQGNFEGGQPWRVWWVWTYFIGQVSQGWSVDPGAAWHIATAPGNPFWWIAYLAVLCALAVVLAVLHDREAARGPLVRLAVGLAIGAVALGVLTMTVGYTEVLSNPLPCQSC